MNENTNIMMQIQESHRKSMNNLRKPFEKPMKNHAIRQSKQNRNSHTRELRALPLAHADVMLFKDTRVYDVYSLENHRDLVFANGL